MKRIIVLLVLISITPHFAALAQPEIKGLSLSARENLYWPRPKRGERSEKVRTLQCLLTLHGAPVKVDGRFGFATESAVRRFQKSKKLTVDGVVGAQTWETLVVPLRRGSRGQAVRIFQSLLSQNRPRVKSDGVFGAATERAVRAYQRKEGEDIMIISGRAEVWVWCWLLGGMNSSD